MSRNIKTIFLAVLLVVSFFLSPAFADKRTPQNSVEQMLTTIQKIKTGDKLTADEKKANSERSRKALKYLNIKVISQKTLGKHWKKLSDEDKTRFSKLLGDLFIHVAFPNSGKFFTDLKLVFTETEIEKETAFVPMSVRHKNEGEIEIDFYLKQNSDDWKVVDVHMDGVSMRNNLRSQFKRILSKEKFSDLIRRMEKKLKAAKT